MGLRWNGAINGIKVEWGYISGYCGMGLERDYCGMGLERD